MNPSERSTGATFATNSKVEVKGSVNLGKILDLQQRTSSLLRTAFRYSTSLPFDGVLQAIDTARVETSAALPMEQLSWELELTETPIEITDKGLTESYMIFGGPGSGKTYLLMYLLRQISR